MLYSTIIQRDPSELDYILCPFNVKQHCFICVSTKKINALITHAYIDQQIADFALKHII